jgi:3-hydroxybutyryl-CoA dehydratase
MSAHASAPLVGAKVGDRLPERVHAVDQALTDRYAEVSGDRNPLHTSPEFAATTHYGRTIAHGMMTLAFLSDAMAAWAGPAWLHGGEVEVTFLAPVFPGDMVTVTAEVVGAEADGTRICRIACLSGGRTVMAGETRATVGAG